MANMISIGFMFYLLSFSLFVSLVALLFYVR